MPRIQSSIPAATRARRHDAKGDAHYNASMALCRLSNASDRTESRIHAEQASRHYRAADTIREHYWLYGGTRG